LQISPKEIYELSEGFVPVLQMKQVLKDYGFSIDILVSYDNLTRLCKETRRISQKEIRSIAPNLNP